LTRSPWLGLAGWLAVTAAAAVVGGIASVDAKTFYDALAKPGWAPPAWLFGPAWTLLYTLMAIGAWLVWRVRGFAGARGALSLYLVQLVVNTGWTWLFFARRSGALAFADIVVLWILVAMTVVAFARVHRGAAALLLPYLAWITYAAALNYATWTRNPSLL
jgi:tryptophan-rich sensory protein